MPETNFYAAVGETLELDFVLRGKNRLPQDLTSATSVKLLVRSKDDGTVVVNEAACTFTPDAQGIASYRSPAVIAYAAGWYEVRVTAGFGGGITRKFPDKGFGLLLVSPA